MQWIQEMTISGIKNILLLYLKRKIRTWTGILTSDLRISRPALYHLSYPGSHASSCSNLPLRIFLLRSNNVNFPRHKLWVCFQLIIWFKNFVEVVWPRAKIGWRKDASKNFGIVSTWNKKGKTSKFVDAGSCNRNERERN